MRQRLCFSGKVGSKCGFERRGRTQMYGTAVGDMKTHFLMFAMRGTVTREADLNCSRFDCR